MSEAVSQRDQQRERVITAAFELFAERGYEGTTVEAIADRAGVGRTTFFRMFRSKESVVFPAHDQLLAAIEARLTTARPGTEKVALSEASELVLEQYLHEGARARQRYALTREVEALRERERASIFQYERLFRRFIHQWWGGTPDTLLRAELAANAVVTAHNHVLRAWLRGDVGAEEARIWFRDVIAELDATLGWEPEPQTAKAAPDRSEAASTGMPNTGDGEGEPAVIVVRDAAQLERMLPTIRRMLR